MSPRSGLKKCLPGCGKMLIVINVFIFSPYGSRNVRSAPRKLGALRSLENLGVSGAAPDLRIFCGGTVSRRSGSVLSCKAEENYKMIMGQCWISGFEGEEG